MHKILANTSFLGKEIISLPECHSTNDIAVQKFKNKEVSEGSVILADYQSKGRGQRGNIWESEPGKNLTFSLVLTPHFLEARQQFGLNMAIALAVREALAEYSPGILVKWPNDIVQEEQGKIGGILIENTISHRGIESSIVGIGLNINQTKFTTPSATSMALLTGAPLDREGILDAVMVKIEHFYLILKNKGEKHLMNLYQSHLFRFGKWSPYDDGDDFFGKIIGIADQGKLIIQKEDESLHQYAFKEVRFM